MGYEIWEERLVTRDGKVEDGETHGHRATVYGEGVVEIRLAMHMRGVAYLTQKETDEDGDVCVQVTDLRAALLDLARLSPFNSELSSEDSVAQERAARVVEQVCEVLNSDPDDPVNQALILELRSTMLNLIERATGTK